MADPVLNAAGGGAKWTRRARWPRGWAEPRSRKGPSGRPLRLHGRFRNVRPPGTSLSGNRAGSAARPRYSWQAGRSQKSRSLAGEESG